MKRILSISLILLIAFNAGGYFFVYFQLENYFKQIAFNRINEFIPIEQLEIIEIDNKSSLSESKKCVNIIDEKEILYNGKMYDIYKMDIREDKTILYCVNDENEDIIQSAFSEYLNEKDSSFDAKSIANIIKILITIGLEPNQNNLIPIRFHNNLTFFYIILFGSINIDIPSPPPRFFS